MIYYPPQILFLLRARQLRSRSSIFFPFTAHRATLSPLVPFTSRFFSSSSSSSSRFCTRRIVSPFARPLCSAPSLKVTDCLLYYPLVSIFTLLSEALLASIVPAAANSYGHNTVLKDFRRADHCRGCRRFCSHFWLVHVPRFRTASIQCAESSGNGSANNEPRICSQVVVKRSCRDRNTNHLAWLADEITSTLYVSTYVILCAR